MKTTIPLLHDRHNHVCLYAALSSCVDIAALPPEAALATLRGLPRDRLTVVKGWKSFELGLDAATLASLPPALIVNFSLHGFVVSDAALPYMAEAVPELVERRHDQVWCEANVPAIFEAYCGLAGLRDEQLRAYVDGLVPLGIGSSDEMTVPTVEALDVALASSYAGRVRPWVAPALYRKLDEARRNRVMGIKLYLDGAVGSRSAAIAGPWIGPGRALFTYSDERLLELVGEAAESGAGLAMHAIGELAVEQALVAIERARGAGGSFGAVRIEHAQFIDLGQARRAKRLGVTLSMQPNFTSDSVDYVDRLPEAYLARNNPFRMLIDEAGFVPGKDLVFGSDGMPDGVAYAATQALFPPYPAQRLSLDELVAGYGAAEGCSGSVVIDIDGEARRVTVVESRLSP